MKDFLTSLYSQEYDVEEKNPDEEEKLKFVIEDDDEVENGEHGERIN